MAVDLLLLCAIIYLLISRRKPHKLLIISFDGFRADFLSNPELTPNLQTFKSQGLHAKYLQSVFPTKTFPNHYSIVTGLYPESHGIVSNAFYDPIRNATFRHWKSECSTDGTWFGGDPIWSTLERAGKKTVVMFWPSSEAEIKGERPTVYYKYAQSVNMSTSDRISKVLEYLKHPSIQFGAVYFSVVDDRGHVYGPDSKQYADAVKEVDAGVGQLMDGLRTSGLEGEVNVMIVSDHGMSALSPERSFNITGLLDISKVNIVENSPNTMIYPLLDSDTRLVYDSLKGKLPDNYKVYLKEDIPEKFNYSNNIRIPPVMIIPEPRYVVSIGPDNPAIREKGNHGFDNEHPDMHGIFLAKGPSFKRNMVMNSLSNVELYSLMAKLMNVNPSPNNSTAETQNLLTTFLA